MSYNYYYGPLNYNIKLCPPPFWISEQGGGALWLVLAPWCVPPGGGILPFKVHDFKQGAGISIYNQYLSIHLSFYSSILPFIYPSIHPSFYSSILLFIYPFIHLSFYSSIFLFIYPSIHLSFYSSILKPLTFYSSIL